VHWAVYAALQPFGKEVLVPHYRKVIEEGRQIPDLKDSLCKELIKLGADGMAKLIGKQLLKEEDSRLGMDYAFQLGRLGDKSALPYLLKAFEKEDRYGLHKGILFALGELRDAKAVKPVIEKHKTHTDREWEVYAYEALGKIGTKEAMKEVYRGCGKATSPRVREAAMAAIGMGGDREHLRKLLPLLQTGVGSITKEYIIDGFVRLKDKAIEPFLKECLTGVHGGMMDRKALAALAELSGDARKYLRGKLSDPSTGVRKRAADLLLEMKDKDSLPEIRKMLTSQDTELAWSVAVSLAQHGDAASADEIRKLIARYPPGNKRFCLRECLMELEKKAAGK
jgi:HEAT repeat protein